MPQRLGLDMGTNSIGWCLIELEETGKRPDGSPVFRPCGVIDAGVRILTPKEEAGRDPKSKVSLAADRREARSTRRRRDRFIRRQKRLMETLITAGLMPADRDDRKALESLDPYHLRAAALDETLPLHELGRIIFHLNQRRGFKSNRLADGDDKEDGAMKTGMKALHAAMTEENARTLGELLARRHARDRHGRRLETATGHAHPKQVRFRPATEGTKNTYNFYPERQMVADELDAIWKRQSPHHPELTDELLARLKRIIIEQRPLKKPDVGRCSLKPETDKRPAYDRLGEVDFGERAPKAHPLFQRFRILQDLCQLRIARAGGQARYLTIQERDALANILMSKSASACTFEKLRGALKLPDDARFNYEHFGRKGFDPDQTAVKLGATKLFGKAWRNFPRERQIEIVERLLKTENPEELKAWLTDTFGMDEETAEAVSKARLPQGHGRFGRGILNDLVRVMETGSKEDAVDPDTGEIYARPLNFDEAVAELGLHHSDRRRGGEAKRLPYYGEAMASDVIAKSGAPAGSQDAIGRVPNPTVHIALNQLRKIVNTLIDEYGDMDEIVVELARELKLNKKRKDEIQRENNQNQKRNEDIKAKLANLGVADTFDSRLRMRLFEELPADERVCVYSGAPLNVERLFDGSVDIDHILPYSKTLDDSFMNKVLCTAAANRIKRNRAPAEAWSGSELQEIVGRAERLFLKKAWRFQPGAMERFAEDGGFLARQLTDTQHMARMARRYLELVSKQVWASPGRLTAMLRHKWALNDLLPDHNFADANQPKNRKDHRHHAIDAFVVACTDRGLLNRLAQASGKAGNLDIDRLFPKDSFPEPFDGYREKLRKRLETLIVSHKPDHGIPPGGQGNVHVTSGQLHEETAYGRVDEEIDGKRYNLVARKPVTGLTEGEIGRVRDAALREELQALAYEAKRDGVKLNEALAGFASKRGIHRVRILKTEKSVRTVRHGGGFTKAYSPGDNHRIEIYELPDGSWAGEGVTVFDANQPDFTPAWRKAHPYARLVMRVHNGDMVEADFGNGRSIFRIYQLRPSANLIVIAAHSESGTFAQRHADPNDPFRQAFPSYASLKKAGARRVRVDPIGRVCPVRDA
ncbi:type II CRISPR RNA-guided endonuclease Cas9 [Hyphobacterium sp. HN65]|uniref:CRISPR-associated endonuclease Cas9 n=1 Tax=Hyphobacterium lacteum TaxID=3116575 RepID=A0ABU7LQR4_9PROT|nr:type II CRISPR RNA-guided endonuclease Cas9 [Hyphobacterium sp. HN65]MEE2526230.1 type II CRISPR RNA-guided endonuclease Cas9 [Hyphobacterium sp. HN65]